jgi:dolichol-phosphate mannosyltransferase
MRRSLPAFLAFLAAYLLAIGWGWFHQTGSGGELLGHAAKIEAILRLLRGGDFAWFPDYLTGSPTATLLSFALSVPLYAPALLLAHDPAIAMKATALALVAASGLAAFAFGRRLARNEWAGFAVGCAWLLCPQILLRLGFHEHMTIVAAIPFVPLAFWALLRVAERGAPLDAILLAVSFSAALLAWSKMGATLVLPLGIFALWLFVTRPECRWNLLRGAMWAVPATLLLGVLPLLPLLRERGFMTVFELDPFAGWQAAFSVKTATSWMDRGGALFQMLPLPFRVDRGGYYLGFVGLAAVAWTIFTTWREARPSREVRTIRLFLLVALAMFWVSFGPRGVLQGHFEFLSVAEDFPDLGIPLHWLVLAAQGVFLFWCVPHGRWRIGAFVAIFAIYLLVPAFRVLEHLPLFADLRAPDSFWILNGSFAWAVASALAVVFVLGRLPRHRALFGALALLAACADFSPYFGWFYRGGLGRETFAQFAEAEAHLRGQPGRAVPVSGRYFYLDLPNHAGRPLTTEALNRYLAPREMARLQAAALGSATDMLAYLRLAGVGDVLLDRKDPDVSEAKQKWFRALLPLRFENERFALLSNPAPLYPGFFATAAVPATLENYQEYTSALEAAKSGRLAVTSPDGLPLEGLPGMKAQPTADFAALPLAEPRTASRVAFDSPGTSGWLVLDESWHPDWTATVDGAPVAVYRAAGGFPAVPMPPGKHRVVFHFEPPAWYAACLGGGALAWVLALGFLCAAPILPRRLTRAVEPPAPVELPAERPPIRRPIAIVPTYNEAENIAPLLGKILATREDLHVLVIDDASPDGTAALVRAHEAFGDRVHLLERSGKLGLGSAYRTGFDWAIARGYDACLEIDADLSHDPADIPRLIAALDAGADAAVGSRYLEGVRVINWPEHRLLLSAGASRYVRLCTGLPLTDATSGFKALRSSALAAIDRAQLRADGYGFQVELHWLLWTAGCRLVEVPIVFTERRVGQTKMSAGIAIEAAWRVLQLSLAPRPQSPRES